MIYLILGSANKAVAQVRYCHLYFYSLNQVQEKRETPRCKQTQIHSPSVTRWKRAAFWVVKMK